MNKRGARAWFLVLALILLIASAAAGYMGYDKLTNYYNSENYPRLNKNAYVGGDAYNYIINGNYATGYFVLCAGSLIAAVICLGTRAIIGAIPDPKLEKEKTYLSNDLPDL